MIRGRLQNLTVCATTKKAVATRVRTHNGEASEPMIMTLALAPLFERAEHPLNNREVARSNPAGSCFTTATWMLSMLANNTFCKCCICSGAQLWRRRGAESIPKVMAAMHFDARELVQQNRCWDDHSQIPGSISVSVVRC